MKYLRSRFVKVLLIIIVIIFLFAGVIVNAYIKNPISVLKYSPDYFISPEVKAKAEYTEFEKIFPPKLENYSLYSYKGELPIRVRSKCDNLSNNPDAKQLAVSGEICIKTISAQYRNTTDNKVILMNFMKVSKGRELMLPLLSRYNTGDTLGIYPILRTEGHEILWLPKEVFDSAGTQEGRWKANSDGGESLGYGEKATGQNPVTQYFIAKYPPNISAQ